MKRIKSSKTPVKALDLFSSPYVMTTNNSYKANTYTTNFIIAKYAGISVRTINDRINQYNNELSRFGVLRYYNAKVGTRKTGRPIKEFHLNENQATLLFTFLKNTPQVVAFKVKLVEAFALAKKMLRERTTAHVASIPLNKEFSEAINENDQLTAKFVYYNNWLYKFVFGRTVQAIRKERNPARLKMNTEALLTVDERNKLNKAKRMMTDYFNAGLNFEEVTEMMSNPIITKVLKAKQPEAIN